MRRIIYILLGILIIYSILKIGKNINWNSKYKAGEVIDEYNNVKIYYNGGVSNTQGRNLSKDGYNLGMKYQCVEFIKRYYFEHFNHKMPDSYGNALDFYDKNIDDGHLNKKRNLLQYSNPSATKPKLNDILIFDKTIFNSYGHVAIISKVESNFIEIIQQNPGPFGKPREKILLKFENNFWLIQNDRILGRLSIHTLSKSEKVLK
ncbi:CHAP domain-containing protein [Flavobacterium sp.]|uniref:CHAP domain-containing protein n=1 Tax=Flavobacterium sp. TaxID=239 RepID=UPI0037513BE9